MPDFVSNFVEIKGDAKTLSALKMRLGRPRPIIRREGEEGWEAGSVFSLLNIDRPSKSQWRKYMNADDGKFHCKWNCEHWGTKWDVERPMRLAVVVSAIVKKHYAENSPDGRPRGWIVAFGAITQYEYRQTYFRTVGFDVNGKVLGYRWWKPAPLAQKAELYIGKKEVSGPLGSMMFGAKG